MTLEERKIEFKKAVWDSVGNNFETYPKQMQIDFVLYWTEHNEPVKPNTKMRFEREKIFQISRRLQTWFNNQNKWERKPGKTFINYFDKKYASKLDPLEHHNYKIHLQQLGFIFGGTETGHWVKPPNGERIWI